MQVGYSKKGLDMNGTHENDVKLIGDDIRTIGRNSDVTLNSGKNIGLAINTGKIKYIKIAHHRGIIANAHIKIGSNSY